MTPTRPYRRVLPLCLGLMATAVPGLIHGQPVKGALYVCDSSADQIVKLIDRDGSGFVELDRPGEVTVFYDDSSSGPDLSTPSHMVAAPGGGLFVLDAGTVDALIHLEDRNHDGDALDDGEWRIFYDASTGGPKLSTANCIVAAPGGGFYIADDGSGAKRITFIIDSDHDGDALEAGESRIVYDATALSLPVLQDIESLAVGSDGTVYAGETTLQAIYALKDLTGDGDFLDEGEVKLFFQSTPDHLLADIDSLALIDGALFACDQDTGLVLRLEDKDGDGVASAPDEVTVFLAEGSKVRVSGVNDFIPLHDGGLLLLDNTKDTVAIARDLNGDGDAMDDGETVRWLVDGGATLGTPHGLVLLDEVGPPPGPTFVRGDATTDGRLDISDPVAVLGILFLGAPAPACLDIIDGDDSGDLNLSDAIYVLLFLFAGGAAPPAPYPDPGADPTADALSC